MTKKKTSKRALLLSALSLLLCVSMLIGSTFAWFTDEVKSGNNKIVAGNLDVELQYNKVVGGELQGWQSVEGATEIFDPNALWEPGRVEVVYLRITNLGTLALKYQLGVNIIDETPGINVDGDPFKLSDYLVFKTVEMPDGLTTYTDRQAVEEAAGTEMGLTDYNGKTATLEAKNAEGTSNYEDYVALIVYMPETVDNDANYRGDAVPTINLGINLFATQKDFESDSFGKDYDEDAWNEKFKITSVEDLQTAINLGKKQVVLATDIEVTEPFTIPAGATVALDLNGNAFVGELSKAAGAVLVNEGTLTITGGTVENKAVNGGAAIDNKGTLTLADVTVKGAPIADSSYPEYAIVSTGNLTVEKGTVVISDRGALCTEENATTTINGGSFTVTNAASYKTLTCHTVAAESGSKIVINNGTFENKYTGVSGASVLAPIGGVIVVNGGTISDDVADTSNFNNTANIQNYMGYAGSYVEVKGGTFNDNSVLKNVATGYQAVANTDGTYTVLPVVEGDTLTAVAGYPGVYSGTKAKTYYVSGADGLVNATELMNTISTGEGQSATFTLMGNVDMAGKTWKPIDKMWVNFDGNGYTISNLTAEAWKAGFFGYLGGGEIKNLTLENVNVTGAQVGAFAGSIEGKITNCYLKGDNTITWAPKYQFEDPNGTLEAWNGIGAITGVAQDVTVNAEIVAGATVTLNKAGFVTVPDCTFVDNLTGYINANKGTVVNNGQIFIGVSTADELTAAVSNAADGDTIKLLNAITGTAVALQKKDVDVVIDGNNNKFDGTIRINGARELHNTETLTIQNVKFVADGERDFIDCNEVTTYFGYAHNVTLKNCSFTGTGNEDVVALRLRQTRNITVEDCTATGLHSLIWAAGTDGVNVIDVTVENCKNGVSVEGDTKVTLKDSTIETTGAEGYAIRVQANAKSTTKISGCTLKAAVPVLLRKASGTYNLAIEGENTFTAANADGYQIIITDSDFGAGKTLTAPSGNGTVTGTDSFVVYNG